MSSFYDYEHEVIKEHDSTKPFAPENGDSLKFNVGDFVTYTNDYGATFQRRVISLYKPEFPNALYATGSRYFLDNDSYWMPVREASLTLILSDLFQNDDERQPTPTLKSLVEKGDLAGSVNLIESLVFDVAFETVLRAGFSVIGGKRDKAAFYADFGKQLVQSCAKKQLPIDASHKTLSF